MNDPELIEQVRALSERVERLEKRGGDEGGLDLHLLERLDAQDEPEYRRGPVQGALTYAGSLRIEGQPLVWQRNLAAPEILGGVDADRAPTLAAAGHPVRLALLKRLCAGAATSPELVDLLDLSSKGKLYHHVDKLVAVGWVRSAGRGSWELAPEKLVPTLLLMALVDDLA